MKKIYLLLLPFLLLSCVDYSEDVNRDRLLGNWVHEFSNDYETIENTIAFQTDGSYVEQYWRTENADGFEPGLLAAYRGKYSLETGILTFSDKKYFFAADYENPPTTIEALQQQENVPFTTQTVEVTFEENDRVMILLATGCNDMIPGMSAFCVEPVPVRYTKVE